MSRPLRGGALRLSGLLLIAPCLLPPATAGTTAADAEALRAQLLPLIEGYDAEAVRVLGPSVLPVLLELYERGDESRKAQIANVLYQLGWPSEKAKDLLLRDIHTPSEPLRIAVQYALGRLSSDEAVIDALLDNMRHGDTWLMRDKAACALAYDQALLSERQKVRLFKGLIEALDDPQLQVRAIAAQALEILTGQQKGFIAAAPASDRQRAVAAWRTWLASYEREID